jgi:hypothetical protein
MQICTSEHDNNMKYISVFKLTVFKETNSDSIIKPNGKCPEPGIFENHSDQKCTAWAQ